MSGLGLGLGTRMDLRADLKLAPRMIQSMEILQMPIMDLLDRVQAELQENPFLEQRDPKNDDTNSESTDDSPEADFDPDGILKHDDSGDLEFARMDELNKDWQDHFDSDHRPSRNAVEEMGDRRLDVMQNIEESPLTLQEHLQHQVSYLSLDTKMSQLVLYVISHLDENGYLIGHDAESGRVYPMMLEDLVASYPDPTVTIADMDDALAYVQELEPSGVGARDVKECLLLQVDEDMPLQDLLRQLIVHHMEDVALNRLPMIQKRTHRSLEDIQEAIELLRHLDPKPGSKFSTDHRQYVVPDIIVERTDDGNFDIRLTDDWLPNITVSKKYIPVVKDRSQPKPIRQQLREQLQSANWLLTAIEQRRATLVKVTRAIITHQRAFLDQGPDHIQPLRMDQIAEQVGVHVTTVSRAVDDKWVQTPRGVFALRRFFGGGTRNEQTGEEIAWETIKQKLYEIIAQEDKTSPLSDEDIAVKFTEAGLKVARRTVTKYRESLKIPTSRQRRDWSKLS